MAGSLDGRVVSGAQRLDVQAELANLHQDAPAAPANRRQDVRHSDDRNPDLPEAAVQSLDPLVEKVQLVAKFPVGERWEELPSREVLEVLDRVVHLQVFHSLGRLDVQDSVNLDQGDRVVKAIPDQDDRVDRQSHRMEVLNNTRFLF